MYTHVSSVVFCHHTRAAGRLGPKSLCHSTISVTSSLTSLQTGSSPLSYFQLYLFLEDRRLFYLWNSSFKGLRRQFCLSLSLSPHSPSHSYLSFTNRLMQRPPHSFCTGSYSSYSTSSALTVRLKTQLNLSTHSLALPVLCFNVFLTKVTQTYWLLTNRIKKNLKIILQSKCIYKAFLKIIK